LKALAFDPGPPLVGDEPAAAYERASDEHGKLGISGATNRLDIVCVLGNRVAAALADPRERCDLLRLVGGSLRAISRGHQKAD
jgi:hypothetical protein